MYIYKNYILKKITFYAPSNGNVCAIYISTAYLITVILYVIVYNVYMHVYT